MMTPTKGGPSSGFGGVRVLSFSKCEVSLLGSGAVLSFVVAVAHPPEPHLLANDSIPGGSLPREHGPSMLRCREAETDAILDRIAKTVRFPQGRTVRASEVRLFLRLDRPTGNDARREAVQ
jgi:hypothetical protein